jgi:hypothetical protein
MEKISDILLSQVVDEKGRKYGQVFELRSEGDPEHGVRSDGREVNQILCGNFGVLEELGFRPRGISIIQWSSVVDISPGKIVIRPLGN